MRIHYTGIFMLILIVSGSSKTSSKKLLSGKRPEPSERKFVSTVIDEVINQVKQTIKNTNTAVLFENSFPNTLDTTVQSYQIDMNQNPDTFVITGDINAMWLRDSSNQVLTYKSFFNKDDNLKSMVKGVIRRQIQQVLLDPFANAFNFNKEGSDWATDYTTRNFFGIKVRAMISQLHERKFEIDSLTSVLRLQNVFYQQTQDSSFVDFNYFKSLVKILTIFRDMQNDQTEEQSYNRTPYTFQRRTEETTDTTSHGQGFNCKHTGLIRSFFRPSDDSTLFQFNIPNNAFASAILSEASDMLLELSKASKQSYLIGLLCQQLTTQTRQLSDQVKEAIYKHGLSANGDYFMYEVDGFGNGYFMDDANQPSLLGLPLFNFIDKNDKLYLNTRMRVLGENNPYYFKGTVASGIGGPHVGIGYIWPMSIITQAMTTDDREEIKNCLQTLVSTTAGTQFIHESFHKNNQYDFTRSWFAWANGLFGELVLRINDEMPDLLKE